MLVRLFFLKYSKVNSKKKLVGTRFNLFFFLATTSSKPTKSTFLTTINLLPLKGSKVDLTLSNIGRQENCFLDRGNSRTHGYAFNTHKLVVPHNSTEFVSCRYELGPIDKRHIGAWTICGRADDDIISDRCQRINILGTGKRCIYTIPRYMKVWFFPVDVTSSTPTTEKYI